MVGKGRFREPCSKQVRGDPPRVENPGNSALSGPLVSQTVRAGWGQGGGHSEAIQASSLDTVSLGAEPTRHLAASLAVQSRVELLFILHGTGMVA